MKVCQFGAAGGSVPSGGQAGTNRLCGDWKLGAGWRWDQLTVLVPDRLCLHLSLSSSGVLMNTNVLDQIKSDCILKSSLLTLEFDVKFTLHALYNTYCTPCTIHTAHLEQYTWHTGTIHTACLAQYTLHTLYRKVLLVGCLNLIPNQTLRVGYIYTTPEASGC